MCGYFLSLEQYYESYRKLRCHLYQSAYQMQNFNFIGRHKKYHERIDLRIGKSSVDVFWKEKVYCRIHRGTKKMLYTHRGIEGKE